MPLLGPGRDELAAKAAELAQKASLWQKQTPLNGFASAGTASTTKQVTRATVHGYSNDDVVFVKAVTGGKGSKVEAGQFMRVRVVSTKTIELGLYASTDPGGFIAEEWTTEITALELEKHTELTEAPYARAAIAFSGSAHGKDTQSAAIEPKAAKASVVAAVGVHNKAKAGESGDICYGIEKIRDGEGNETTETIGAGEKLTISGSLIDLITLG